MKVEQTEDGTGIYMIPETSDEIKLIKNNFKIRNHNKGGAGKMYVRNLMDTLGRAIPSKVYMYIKFTA